MKKKSNVVLIVVVVILSFLVLGLGGFIVYDKFLNSNNKTIPSKETEKAKTEEVAEKIDVNSSEVVDLLKWIDVFNGGFVSDNYMAYLFRNDSLSVSKMPSDAIVFTGIENALKECSDCIKDQGDGSRVVSIGLDKVESKIKSIFGNISYDKVNTKAQTFCGSSGYKVSENNYTDKLFGCGQEGIKTKNYQTKVVAAEKKGNSLDISVKVMFASPSIEEGGNDCVSWYEVDCLSGINIYKDFDRYKLIEKTTDNIFSNGVISDEAMIKYNDRLDTYKLHFEKEDGQYYFKSSERL